MAVAPNCDINQAVHEFQFTNAGALPKVQGDSAKPSPAARGVVGSVKCRQQIYDRLSLSPLRLETEKLGEATWQQTTTITPTRHTLQQTPL